MSEIVFGVEMVELKKHVNFVRNGLGASRTDLPVMLFRFDVSDKKATIFASNKEVFCRTEMKITRPEEAENGSFAVLGNKIEKLISQVETEQEVSLYIMDSLQEYLNIFCYFHPIFFKERKWTGILPGTPLTIIL